MEPDMDGTFTVEPAMQKPKRGRGRGRGRGRSRKTNTEAMTTIRI